MDVNSSVKLDKFSLLVFRMFFTGIGRSFRSSLNGNPRLKRLKAELRATSSCIYIMWVKQCHKPPIWEWFIPPIKMVIWGVVDYCFNHITSVVKTCKHTYFTASSRDGAVGFHLNLVWGCHPSNMACRLASPSNSDFPSKKNNSIHLQM